MTKELDATDQLPVESKGIRVGINAAIRARGISGSARTIGHICDALATEPGMEIFTVQPRWRSRKNKLGNAMRDSYWDLWRAARVGVKPDVFLSPCNVGRVPRDVPHLLWIHDTVVLDHPQWHDTNYARYARLLFGFSARHCDRIVTISHHSAARIRSRWPDSAPVEVLHWPAPSVSAGGPRNPPGAKEVLMVAASEFHKNHAAAIDAVRLARLYSGEDVRLVLVGPPGRAEENLQALIHTADPTGRWLERRPNLADDELDCLYRTCWVLLQPAFDEGFCLPLIEAAAHGMPVVHSGRGGMPEVVPCPGGSVHGDRLSARLVELLDPKRYAEASKTSLQAARNHSGERFEKNLTRLVREVAG